MSLLAPFLYELAWVGGLAVVFAVLERFYPVSDRPTLASQAFNICSVTILFALLAFLPLVSGPMFGWLTKNGLMGLVFGNWHAAGTAGLIASALVYVLVWDFFQYWAHRAEHRFEILWKIHSFHHEDDQMNATTSLRVSLWSALFIFLVAAVPTLIICGVDLLPTVGAYLFFKIYGFFNHANIRLNLGPLTSVISGPQWHRLHHDRDENTYNTNFAAFFPVWDIIFGTYRRPLPNEFPETGLASQPAASFSAKNIFKRVLAPARAND